MCQRPPVPIRALSAVLAVAATLIGTAGCRGGPGEEPGTAMAESRDHQRTARLISHVTDGVVARDSRISVRFVDVQPERELRAAALAGAFTFTPTVEGRASWADDRTLVFEPRSALEAGTRYQCVLDVAAVLPTVESVKPFAFGFEIAANRVVSWQADLEPADGDDPEHMVLSGSIELADPTTLDEVERKIGLAAGRERVAMEWRSDIGDRRFVFTSAPVARGQSPLELRLTIPAAPFGLERDVERVVELRPVGDLAVAEVIVHDQEREPRLSIQLSDPLQEDVDASGYVTVEPFVELKVSIAGRLLQVSGAFRRGQDYTLTVRRGLPSRWGARLAADFRHPLRFVDMKPQLAFSQSGALLPSREEGTVAFRTLNLRAVTATVMRVFESNLGQFLQDHDLSSAPTRDRLWGSLDRVGIEVASQELEIGDERNRWVQSTLDLERLVTGHERGLYLVTLSFSREQMLYDCEEGRSYPYWEHPCGEGYARNRGTVAKPVILTDVGLLAKRAGNRLIVAATHLGTATPLPGVDLTLVSLQNQPLERHTTGEDGIAEFATTDGFIIEARWKGQRSALKFSDSALSLSGFEVGGSSGSAAATRAFVYSDRGVYRPGDPIHLAAIVRNQDDGFPDDHPLRLRVRNPRDQVVHEEVSRTGLAGHYAFVIRTGDGDPTGSWFADLFTGDTLLASHRLRIETVVPNRLKVNLQPDAPRLGPEDREVGLELTSSYLFGAPAAGLDATLAVSYRAAEKRFEAYPDYSFLHPAERLSVSDQTLLERALDGAGRARVQWRVPALAGAPSAVTATLTARVFERGGRPTTQALEIPIDPYPAYVGLRTPKTSWVEIDRPLDLEVVLLDRDGTPVPGRELEVTLSHNERAWWWEYRSFEDYSLRFKSDISTTLLERATVTSGVGPVAVRLAPDRRGQILVEIRDPAGGHHTGVFLWASSWGSQSAPITAGAQLEMELDRERYRPGEVAHVAVKTPSEGVAFVSVEKGDRVLDHRWVPLAGPATTLDVPVTEAMLPNAYLHVVAIQPHAQTSNDRPLRLHGVVPIPVEQVDTRLEVELTAPGTLRPGQDFEVEVKVPPGRPATVTVAVVDEGLLDLTAFTTPDPWQFFFAKERLSVATFDVFDQVIGAIWGDVHRRFEVGGDEDSFRQKRSGPVKARRFPPVALFSAPVRSDGTGRVRARFTMPRYLGSVRVMAVAAAGGAYGSAEAAVPVRDPLVLLPTLPRVAGPDESFELPVTVFALDRALGEVEIAVEATGPLAVVGPARAELSFDSPGERDVAFTLAAGNRAGVATVTVTATAKGARSEAVTELAVRPVNPYRVELRELVVPPGGELALEVPALGVEGTRSARLRISTMPGLTFGHRLTALVRYPYGCMEQTMSAVFPQLFLKDLMAADHQRHDDLARQIDRNLDAGIERLRRFTTPEGGFAYWPGGAETDQWATNYGGHYLLEARRAGYHVPDDLLRAWTGYQKRMAAREAGDLRTRCYRLFVLALAGEPQTGPMNLMKEERLDVLDPLSRWLLAAAYQLSGMDAAARQLVSGAPTAVPPYREQGATYGSGLRDAAMMLYLATLMERDQTALELYSRVNTELGGTEWLSTHEAGYALLAAGSYLRRTWRQEAPVRGVLELGDGARGLTFDQRGGAVGFDLAEAVGRTVTVRSRSDAPLHAVLEWEGIPIEGPTEPEARNLALERRFLDEDGRPTDPSRLAQGSLFWCHLRVSAPSWGLVENVALTQIFPSGWEIDATRLRGEAPPDWARRLQLGREVFTDIRDDRVMWFFDLRSRQPQDFLVKLVAVTRGSFLLAPASVEAMYDPDFRALIPGGRVEVVAAEGK